MYFGQLTVTFPTAIGAIGNIKRISFINSLIWIALLPLSYVMFKLGAPPESLYINFILMYIALSGTSVYFLKRLGGLSLNDFFINVVARSLGASILTFLLSIIPLFFLDAGLVRLALVVLVNIMAFLFFLFIIGLKKSEKQLLIKALISVKQKVIKR
jgi:hypothetical protein